MKKIHNNKIDIWKHFSEEHMSVGTERVSSRDAWFAILLAFFISLAVIANTSENPGFVIDCSGCGGAWTHAVINGELQEKVINFPEELSASANELSDTVNLNGGATTFFLGFLSSILIVGLFEKDYKKARARKRRSKARKNSGFIKTGFLYTPLLILFLAGASSFPISSLASENLSRVSLPVIVPDINLSNSISSLGSVKKTASIEVMGPSAGDIWKTRENISIRWSSSGFRQENVKIFFRNLSENKTLLVKEYSNRTASSAKSFNLRIPSHFSSGTYKIIVCDTVKNVCGESSAFFID